MAPAVEALSKALKDLRDIGVNVQLQLSRSIFEDSFSLARKAGNITGEFTLSASGVLKIDQSQFLLAISTSENLKGDVLKIYVSDREYSSRVLRSDFRGACYDLNANAAAMQEFQTNILQTAACNEIIRDHDVSGTLGFDGHGKPKLLKPALNNPVFKL